MKMTKNSNRYPLLITAIVVAIILIAAAFYYIAVHKNVFYWFGDDTANNNQSINYDPPTREQIDAGQSAKEEAIEKNSNPEISNSLSVSITAASQNNPIFQIRAMIDGVLGSSGQCKLLLTKGNAVVSKSAAIQPLASTSTCKGFDIPISELSPGTWVALITVTSGDKIGQAEKSIEIN